MKKFILSLLAVGLIFFSLMPMMVPLFYKRGAAATVINGIILVVLFVFLVVLIYCMLNSAPDLSGRTKEEYEIDQYFANRNFEAKKKYYQECLEEDRKAAQEKESGNSAK